MNDFFGALELELREAGERSPRRRIRLGDVAALVAVAALLASAVIVARVVAGGGEGSRTVPSGVKPDPVGTVIPDGEGTPPRRGRSVVVATGTAPGIGPWQMEASRSSALRDPDSGELYQPAGLRCLSLVLVDPRDHSLGAGGQCGEFPRTPGFSRLQMPGVYMRGDSEEARRLRRRPVLVYGRVPERAALSRDHRYERIAARNPAARGTGERARRLLRDQRAARAPGRKDQLAGRARKARQSRHRADASRHAALTASGLSRFPGRCPASTLSTPHASAWNTSAFQRWVRPTVCGVQITRGSL